MEPVYEVKWNSGILKAYEDRMEIGQHSVAGIKGTMVSSVIYYSDITSIRFKKSGWTPGQFIVDYSGTSAVYIFGATTIGRARQVGDEMEQAYNYIMEKVEHYRKNPNVSTTCISSSADEILKFKGLLDQGIITQEEFDAKKKQLLGL